MYNPDNQIYSDDLYQKEMNELLSETNKKAKVLLKKLKDQSKPELGSSLS